MNENAQKLLNYLVKKIKDGNILAEDPGTFIGYKEALISLGLPHIADTYGRSLELQGLRELAEWIEEKKLPAITGIIVDKQSMMPSRGYFEVYGKDKEDFKWWSNQIKTSFIFEWGPYLQGSEEENSGFITKDNEKRMDTILDNKTYLLTWNPDNWTWENISEMCEQVKSDEEVELRWNCRSEKVKLGDRLFLIKQGVAPKGIFASGVCVKEPYKDKHYDQRKQRYISYIHFKVDILLDPDNDSLFPVYEQIPSYLWDSQTSGINLPDDIAKKLEEQWKRFNQDIRVTKEQNNNQNGAGYGNKDNNRMVEQAAIKEVRRDYQDKGWMVNSVESEKCGYDLVCTRGRERHDVEVKGVSGNVCNFILTYGELEQAKSNQNFKLCVVTNALIEPNVHKYSGNELISKFDIKAIQYRASLKI